eukprot:3859311-Rhodomonas_salina.2
MAPLRFWGACFAVCLCGQAHTAFRIRCLDRCRGAKPPPAAIDETNPGYSCFQRGCNARVSSLAAAPPLTSTLFLLPFQSQVVQHQKLRKSFSKRYRRMCEI